MEFSEKKDYYDAAMRQIKGDSWSLSAYGYLKSNEEWIGRYEDFLREGSHFRYYMIHSLRRYLIRLREETGFQSW